MSAQNLATTDNPGSLQVYAATPLTAGEDQPSSTPLINLNNRAYLLTPLTFELMTQLEYEAIIGTHTNLKALLEEFRNAPNNLDLQKQILGILFFQKNKLFQKTNNKSEFRAWLLELRKISVIIDTGIPECLEYFPLWQNQFGFSLAHHHAARGDLVSLKRELESLNQTLPLDLYGFTPLFDAYCHEQTEVQNILRDHFQHTPESWTQVSVNQQEQWTLLHSLTKAGDQATLEKVLQRCPGINLLCQFTDKSPWPIHYAIGDGHYKLLPLLYDKKMKNTSHLGRFSIDYLAQEFWFPHAMETLRCLISLGEDINKESEMTQADEQTTALGVIIFVNLEDTQLIDLLPQRLAFARELLRLGADINQLSSYFCSTSLTPSAGPGQPQKHSLLQACIDHLGDPNPNPSVVDAAQNNRQKYFLTIMHFLIQQGIRLDHRDLNDLTALERAKKDKIPAAAIQLLENHEEILNPDSGGESVLRHHIGNNAPLVMQYLYVTARQNKTYPIATTATQPTPKAVPSTKLANTQ